MQDAPRKRQTSEVKSVAGTLTYGPEGHSLGAFVAPYLVRLIQADRPQALSARYSIAEVRSVQIGRGEACGHKRRDDGTGALLHLTVPDGWMSTKHLQLDKQEDGSWRLRDCGSKNGSFRNGQRCEEAMLVDGDLLHTGNTTFLFRDKIERSHLDPADCTVGQQRNSTETLYLPLSRMIEDMAKVAPSTVSIILGGASGTGKDVSAQYIHRQSKRAGAFVAVNCGAIPETLVESELFGHRKGAFSGALTDRIGLVQAADGGTLFLDEVAELPLAAQVKLLRVLQEREIVPVGATRPIPVDLRVVAATHRNLPQLVSEGAFREDLYARLAGVSFHLPSLQERREDLGMLIASLLRRCNGGEQVFEREAVWALALYHWPRNIRQLEQALSAAVAWAGAQSIGVQHLPPEIAAVLQGGETDVLCEQLKAALRKHRGNVSATAREMGKARVQIRRWCKRYNIVPKDFAQ